MSNDWRNQPQTPYSQDPYPAQYGQPQNPQGGQGAMPTDPANPYLVPTQPPYGQAYSSMSPATRTSGVAIAGFILSFILPLAGLIVSIIAYSESKRKPDQKSGMAIAGVIISAVGLVLRFIVLLFVFMTVQSLSEFSHGGYHSDSITAMACAVRAKGVL
ncbi:hypothetical protein BACT_1154 [Bifidobacterium actinocoloniiforme DSM 22766]|uniref:DUF4190 domain-containing protein n=1 Tax=Bifidobacterium actinocoloniiforme DSM 22766 TaxID=1437605 RepID=A0A086Z1Q0_9BIFI|nr:DUF4190 domain-containing protein [Bifidobacterium actinocoloniiforme]KFI40450.1 hypothetical protein BACT_1154 [Bifidobacterium actinocoloniiforme DSM 22766]